MAQDNLLYDWIQIFIYVAAAGLLSYALHHAGHKSASGRMQRLSWLPFLTTLVYGWLVALVHFYGWVPVPLAALLILPCVLVPPLIYRVRWPVENTPPPDIPLFALEETRRTQSEAAASRLLQQFLERYPNAQAFIYRYAVSKPNSVGGLILHSREPLRWLEPTFLEITLDCPFTIQMGKLAEGHEVFQAFVSRPRGEATVITPLPMNDWDSWVAGLRQDLWFDYIQLLDTSPVSHPRSDVLPLQFTHAPLVWQPIQLK